MNVKMPTIKGKYPPRRLLPLSPMSDTFDAHPALQQNPWFGGVPAPQQQAMLAVAQTLSLQPGTAIYRKGDKSTGFYCLLEGSIKVSNLGEDGREGILSVLDAGNWFGEIGLLDGLPRPHDFTAISRCELLAIPVAAFEQLMQNNAFARAMSVLLCMRVRALLGYADNSMLGSTRSRVAGRLLLLARGDSTMTAEARSRVPVSQEALAMMLGLTRQTLSKELRALEKAGVLRLGYGDLHIVSMAELAQQARL
jgi:CRP/FNR family transcriptional regulator, cyclic AMP receptor protein